MVLAKVLFKCIPAVMLCLQFYLYRNFFKTFSRFKRYSLLWVAKNIEQFCAEFLYSIPHRERNHNSALYCPGMRHHFAHFATHSCRDIRLDLYSRNTSNWFGFRYPQLKWAFLCAFVGSQFFERETWHRRRLVPNVCLAEANPFQLCLTGVPNFIF